MTLGRFVSEVCDECNMSRRAALNESLAWLKMRLKTRRRRFVVELLEMLQVVGAGAGAPYGGRGYDKLAGILRKRLKT